MDFVAIDVETANPNMASICQVGLAGFQDGVLASEWKSYVNPRDRFHPINVSIHGIGAPVVVDAPTFAAIADELFDQLRENVVVSHGPFDRTSIHRACIANALDPPALTWLDSICVARRAWENCAQRGYGLADVCTMIGYDFKHHDALEDAKAAGHVMLAACAATGLSIEDWLARVELSLAGEPRLSGGSGGWSKASFAREGYPDGPLAGEVIVFTGALRIPRGEAADMAASVGCRVDQGVTKRTTMLVVGDQDVTMLAGHDKSSKHRKAEQLIGSGQCIRILRESDFLELVRLEAIERT